jgi:L-ascorbate metabolism protein UlaG (beta-lactamase superfamily)
MADDAHPVRITFVGNEGVLVERGEQAVLIDALFGDGAAAYTTTPRAVIDSVEMARNPFDAVDAALATHFHPDHFNPYSTARFLQHSERSHLLSTPQAVALLGEKAAVFDDFAGRVHATHPGEGAMESNVVGGVTVEAFGLSHGKVNYGDVEHLGLLVDLAGAAVLHLGDGMIAERALREAGVLDRSVDVAFVPFWFLTYPMGRRLMETALRPRHVFAVHIPPAHARRLVAAVAASDPAAVPLVEPMVRHSLPVG